MLYDICEIICLPRTAMYSRLTSGVGRIFLKNNLTRRIVEVKRADKRSMHEGSFKQKLVKSWLTWSGHVEKNER